MNYSTLLTKYPNLIVKENEALSKYTFTETGGNADLFFLPSSIEEVQNVITWTKENNYPLTIIGSGSNLIVRDGGIRGVTVVLSNLKNIRVDKNRVIVESGARIIEASEVAYKYKLTGLEFACGIPGSIGGAVYMNAGAYGGEVKDVIESMTILKRNGTIKIVSNEEMNFSYRYSKLMETGDIVLEVTFLLKRGFPLAIKTRMLRLNRLRRSKQPLEYPSCGSVFKNNPEGMPSPSRLIVEAKLQGEIRGGAQLSKKHPNFIVNINNATSTDYINLIEYIQDIIFQEFSIRIEPEPRIIGEVTDDQD